MNASAKGRMMSLSMNFGRLDFLIGIFLFVFENSLTDEACADEKRVRTTEHRLICVGGCDNPWRGMGR